MKIKSKKILIITLISVMSFQLVGCKTNSNQEDEITIEQQNQLLLQAEREKALKEIEEKEILEKEKRKKIQSQITQIEEDVSTIVEYMWSYDFSSEIVKMEKDKNYITFKENTLTYQKINEFKKSTSNFDETLKPYSDIYIEYLEKMHSITINFLKSAYTKSLNSNNSTKIISQFVSEIQVLKIEYDTKLVEYYNEYLVEYEKENNVMIKHPSILISDAFYKARIILESVIPTSLDN